MYTTAEASAVVRIGTSRSLRSSDHEVGAELLALAPQSLIMPDEDDGTSGARLNTADEPCNGAERDVSARDQRRQDSPGERHGKGEEGQHRQTPTDERGLQQQEDHDQPGYGDRDQA